MTGEFFELMDLWRRQMAFAGGFAAMAPSAGFVVATRLAQMAGQPSYAGAREAERMVSEKMSALMEGGFAASRALSGLAMAASPVAAGHIMVSAGEAALKPAARKLKANAQRLSR
jgi:hypothetical protein